ncbi:MAG TPA: periplasmic heavy metal sensor [Lacunisphaera sp.]
MRYLWRTLGVLSLAALAAGFLCYHMSSSPALHAAVKHGDAMEWLRADFHLTDGQFAEIQKLHEAYAPSCAEHCRMIQEATKARDAIVASHGTDPAAVAAAERTLQEMRSTCETAIATHVRKVAALMSPTDGQRYLALVLPKIANFDHQMAPELDMKGTP